jgi:hypothetical protein
VQPKTFAEEGDCSLVAYFQGLQNYSAGLLLCIRNKRAVESFERGFKSEQGGTNAFHCQRPNNSAPGFDPGQEDWRSYCSQKNTPKWN